MTVIGPTADHIRLMGYKIAAKQAAIDTGMPVVPGSPGGIGSEVEAA
jgi:acetyl-CoA carboxylase biotin carboxylase subunit